MIQEVGSNGPDRYQLNGAVIGLILGIIGGAVYGGIGGAIAGGVIGLFLGGMTGNALTRLKGRTVKIAVGLIIIIFAIVMAQNLLSGDPRRGQTDDSSQTQNAGSYKGRNPERRD